MSAMQKTSLSFVVFSSFLLAALAIAPTADAFQAKVLPNQVLELTYGKVLGDSDTTVELKDDRIEIQPEGKKVLPNVVNTTAKEALQLRNNELRLKVEDGKGKLEVQPRGGNSGQSMNSGRGSSPSTGMRPPEGKPVEQFEDRYMRLEMPRPASPGAQRPAGTVTIQTPPRQNNPANLELEAGGMRAPLPPGAEFTVDPETSSITITNPNGTTHELTNLPDQAFERIRERLTVDPTKYDEVRSNLIMTNNDDGTITYKTEVTEEKKAFGLIPLQVKTEYKVNDATGEVTSAEVQTDSFFGRLLRRFAR